MTRLRMKTRLNWVAALVVTAIIAATGTIIDMERLSTISAFRQAIVNLGIGMSRQTGHALGAIDLTLTHLQTKLTTGALPIAQAMGSKATSQLLADESVRLPSVDAISLIDADGRIANSSQPAPLADAAIFRHFKTNDDHNVVVGAPVKNPRTGEWTASMARRIDGRDGRFAGLVTAEISLSHLENFYQLAMPTRRTVYIARRDGVVMVRYPARDGEIGNKIPAPSAWYPAVAKGGGTYQGAAYFGTDPVIASVNPLPNLPFVVEASIEESQSLVEWQQEKLWILLGGILAMFSAIVILRLFGKQYATLETSELALAAKNAELETVYQQLDATLANLPQGVCLFDRDSRLLVFNRQYGALYDLPGDAVRAGMSLAEVNRLRVTAGTLSEQSAGHHMTSVRSIIREGKSHDAMKELANGRTILAHYQPLPGGGWVATHEDVTERRQAEEEISFLAHHDVLTGLANRSLFHEKLAQALAQAERGHSFAVLLLDLDRFKSVNDEFGHPTGDALLRAVAGRLKEIVRDGDTIARLGGDEFGLLLLGASEALRTTSVAERIVKAISAPFEIDGHQLSIGVSIGIATAPGDASQADQLIKNADLALYRSKHEGRGTWRFFEPDMDALAQARRALEIDLRNAVRLEQFTVHYQPIVSSRDRRVSGLEALLRWRHPTRGLVAPGDFIPVAEEIGLIPEIGAWVLHQACAAAAHWPSHIRVAVNLSMRQFNDDSLPGVVAHALASAGIAANRLELEITESVPLKEDQATLSILQQLRSLGVRIALDDFGTGYSSLSYLRSFPFDTIKIDRSFVNDLQIRGQGGAIIRGLIGLAANLDMSVTAEGIETEDQFSILSGAGCQEIQGYLISRPIPPEEISALLLRLEPVPPAPSARLAVLKPLALSDSMAPSSVCSVAA